MRIGVLTSSRADYGIYRPLLIALKEDPFFELSIIAFGTHPSSRYGNTIDEIVKDGFNVKHVINSMLLDDNANAIATAVALTALKFAEFWKEHGDDFDLTFCLGDRYEMFAAVTAGIPYRIKFAHFHGGESTMGAIDDCYRHSITHASMFHFVSADVHADRVRSLLGHNRNIIVCGSLSIDQMRQMEMLSNEAFFEKWKIDLSIPSVLITIHPETIQYQRNETFANEVKKVLDNLARHYQLIFTMPNADTAGSVWRTLFQKTADQFKDRAFAIENFGSQSYFTCMKKSAFMLGNTSSGIIEAATFGKYVINTGERQMGRVSGDNVIHVPFEASKILEAVKKVEGSHQYNGINPYDKGGAVSIIIDALKSI